MGFLRTDYSEVGGFGELPIGEYEVIISKIELTKSGNTGNPMLKMELTIRDDIEQDGGKRKLFDVAVEQANMMWKFQQIAKAAQLPVGEDFETLADFANAIQYKAVRVKTKHEGYNGEKQSRVAFYMESKFGGGGSFNEAPSPFGEGGIQDDDLPF